MSEETVPAEVQSAIDMIEAAPEIGSGDIVTDWSHLDVPDDRPVIEDEDEDSDPEAKTETTEEPVAEEPAEEVAEEEPSAPEIDPELTDKAKNWDNFVGQMKRDPINFIKSLVEAAGGTNKAELINAISDPVDQFDPKTYEPVGELEEAVLSQWDNIRSIPKQINEAKSYALELAQKVDSFYAPVAVANEYHSAILEGIMEAVGMTKPELDTDKLDKAVRGGKSLKEAIREQLAPSLKKSVETAAQKNKARPITPANRSGVAEKFKDGASMAEIMKAFGTEAQIAKELARR